MKKIFVTILASLVLMSCQKADHDTRWSEKSEATVAAIAGEYTMVSAQWSKLIDFSGNGIVDDNMLGQMRMFGWMGMQSVKYEDEAKGKSIIYRSQVLFQKNPDALTQVNLYVPYSVRNESSGHPIKNGSCTIEVICYQFHYKVDADGQITLYNVHDFHGDSEYKKLENVEIQFIDDHCILFNADSMFYDWATSCWQEGHMCLRFNHN